MPPIQLLIKPASSGCNLKCRYCFYKSVSDNRQVKDYGIMSIETLEVIVRKALDYADNFCTLAFQGGEPTLAGLDFYRKLIGFVKKYNTKKIKVNYAIQTNGITIDEDWARFFYENKFLVGLSLDGIEEINNLNRVDSHGRGSFNSILRAAQLFDYYRVEYNILTVVTSYTVRAVDKIYDFYKNNSFKYQQYIPCIDPLNEERGMYSYSLTPEMYSNFLKKLFDLWYKDIKEGNFISIRYFDNLIGMLLGYPPESCGMNGRCTNQNVIEADGSVYPCDFYVLDRYIIGNLIEDSFEDINSKFRKISFSAISHNFDEKCRKCNWYRLCYGGCKRDREPIVCNSPSTNYFCSSYEEFFDYSAERLKEIAWMLDNNKLKFNSL